MPHTIHGVWNLSRGCGRWWVGSLCIEHDGVGLLSTKRFPIRSSLSVAQYEQMRSSPYTAPHVSPPSPPDCTTSQAGENKPTEFCCSEKRPTSKSASPPHQTVNGSIQYVLCCENDLNPLEGASELHMLSANIVFRGNPQILAVAFINQKQNIEILITVKTWLITADHIRWMISESIQVKSLIWLSVRKFLEQVKVSSDVPLQDLVEPHCCEQDFYQPDNNSQRTTQVSRLDQHRQPTAALCASAASRSDVKTLNLIDKNQA